MIKNLFQLTVVTGIIPLAYSLQVEAQVAATEPQKISLPKNVDGEQTKDWCVEQTAKICVRRNIPLINGYRKFAGSTVA